MHLAQFLFFSWLRPCVNLSLDQRGKALSISRSLYKATLAAEKGQVDRKELKDSEAGGKIDYAEVNYIENVGPRTLMRRIKNPTYNMLRNRKIVDQESLEDLKEINRAAVFCVAAWFGNVRLIDNMEIKV